MWTGQLHASPHPDPKLTGTGGLGKNGLTWQQARNYCSSLQLARSTGWRLPTLDEVKAATVVREVVRCCSSHFGETKAIAETEDTFESVPKDARFFKGGINTFSEDMLVFIWTSTPLPSDPSSAWIVDMHWDRFLTQSIADSEEGAICVRSMEPDLLQTAKAAAVDHPVPDIQTLQTFIPLNKARLAYQAGNYQESIAQAQIAISLKADPAVAYWGIGISYGRLGQWDQAISNLESAIKIDKGHSDAKDSLQWAKDSQKAAKHDKTAKDKPPLWK
jgi:tetratricopeptide (TPR) repeat protein